MSPPEPASGAELDAAAGHARRAGAHVRNLLGFDLLNRVARFAAAVLLARALSVEDFGALNVCIAAVGLLVTLTGLGLGEQAARDVAVRPADAGALAARVLAARLLAAAAAVALGLALFAVLDAEELGLAALTGAMALAVAVSAEWLLRGLERMRRLGITLAAGGAVVLGGAALLSATGGSATAALAFFAAAELLATGLAWAFVRREARPRPRLRGAGELLRRSWPLGLASLALYGTYANVDTIVLAAARGAEDAGLYTAPYRVFVTLNLVAVFAAYSYLPMISRGTADGDDSALAGLRIGLGYMLGYGAVVLGLAELGGGEALGLVFGSEFERMGPTLVALCIATVWFSVGYPSGYTLIGAERNSRFLAGAATAALLTFGLDLALIPPFGPIGAAAATSVALVAASLVWLRSHGLLGRSFAAPIATMVLVSLAAVASLLEPGLRPAAGLLTIAAGAAWLGSRRLARGRGRDGA